MHVLLTGPFGKIGYRVAEALLDKGHQLTCFDLDTPTNRKIANDFQGRIRMVWGDIADAQAVTQAVDNQDVVIHNAALIPPATDRNIQLSEKINVGGTQNIIAAIQGSTKKPLLIFPSSISIHGNNSPDSPFPKKTTDPLHGEDNYARHKISCEKLIKQSDLNWVIMRIGACMEGGNSMSLQDSKEMMPLMFGVHPKARIEYVHPKDVATAFVNAINNPEALHKIFFLGGGKGCQSYWKEFNLLVLRAMGIGDLPDRLFGNQDYYTDWMDTEESQRILKFQKHTLEAYSDEIKNKNKWVKPLIFIFRPFIRRYFFSQSAKHKIGPSK